MNSASARFAPANVIVPPVAESNKMLPVPASQTVPSVLAFVHVSETVHVSLPKSMADAMDEMLTAPVTMTLPEVLVMSPPLIVKPPFTVMVFVPLASTPPETVSADAVN